MSLKGAHRPPTAAKPKKHRLEGIDDVILYTTQQANPVAFLYELECARFSRVDFTLDFSGSSNFYVELADGTPAAGAGGAGARGGGGGEKGKAELQGDEARLKVLAEPFRRTRLGRLVLKEPSRPAELKNTYHWSLEDVPPEVVARLLAEGKKKVSAQVHRAAALAFADESCTVAEIERRCRDASAKFVDPSFGPDAFSLYIPKAELAAKAALQGRVNDPSGGGGGGAADAADALPTKGLARGGGGGKPGAPPRAPTDEGQLVVDALPIVWRRPDEFYVEQAPDGEGRRQACDVFAGGIEADDIRQGMLSDCWLMCALSADRSGMKLRPPLASGARSRRSPSSPRS